MSRLINGRTTAVTHHELYQITPTQHPTTDALRTLVLILATVLVGLVVAASVPEQVWAELSAQQALGVPDWHGNVSTQ